MAADYSAPMTVAVPGPTPQVSFKKRTDTEAPVYRIDLSTNLVDWLSNAVVEVSGSPLYNGDGSATVTVEPLINTPSAFFRLQVEP